MTNVVLDTNCLVASLSRKGNYYDIWRGFQRGYYYLCVSNEILEEYEEVISLKTNPEIASNVIELIVGSNFVRFITPYYRFYLIEADKDDNKFVDCAVAANAKYIVSEDAHFRSLKSNEFPYVNVIRLEEFLREIRLLEN